MKYKNFLRDFTKKTIFVQILLLIVLFGTVYFIKLPFNRSDTENTGLATLIINTKTEKRVFEGEVVEDMTILDTLNLATSVGKIKLNYAIDNSGKVNVLEIDGYTNGFGNKYFVFYLNSKKVNAGDLNKKTVYGGDEIEIQYE